MTRDRILSNKGSRPPVFVARQLPVVVGIFGPDHYAFQIGRCRSQSSCPDFHMASLFLLLMTHPFHPFSLTRRVGYVHIDGRVCLGLLQLYTVQQGSPPCHQFDVVSALDHRGMILGPGLACMSKHCLLSPIASSSSSMIVVSHMLQ